MCIWKEKIMEMCYDGTLVMPKNYAVVTEEEMTYVEGGGTAYVKVKRNSFVIKALGALGGMAAKWAMTAALNAIGGSIATAITLGTAGAGTLLAGAFIISWGGIVSCLVGAAVSYGINSLQGKKFKIASGWWCPNKTFTI